MPNEEKYDIGDKVLFSPDGNTTTEEGIVTAYAKEHFRLRYCWKVLGPWGSRWVDKENIVGLIETVKRRW